MLIPVRCFTCGKVTGNKWEAYLSLLEDQYSEKDALDALGLTRYCCRRMLISHVDLIEKLLNYKTSNHDLPEEFGPRRNDGFGVMDTDSGHLGADSRTTEIWGTSSYDHHSQSQDLTPGGADVGALRRDDSPGGGALSAHSAHMPQSSPYGGMTEAMTPHLGGTARAAGTPMVPSAWSYPAGLSSAGGVYSTPGGHASPGASLTPGSQQTPRLHSTPSYGATPRTSSTPRYGDTDHDDRDH
mmetsp:Transcript_32256/g.90333  ORF Transcript_32256/g.90333 Transcript_32256/m.90333 type:complete len:241 (+) Transcript_32256:66-788(+)